MQKLFTRILVPVSFNRGTGLAIDKAIQLANRFACDIHLLYVRPVPGLIPFLHAGYFSGATTPSANKNVARKLKRLEDSSREKLQDGLLISSSVIPGNWQSVMKQTIIAEHIDLVVVPGKRNRLPRALIHGINLNTLSLQTQCPVLTVTSRFNISQLQNIVVPVGDCLPVKKLTIATYLCREVDGNIHLMGSGDYSHNGGEKKRFLIKAYKLLNDYGHVKIHCSLSGDLDNPASTLAYAREVQADLIVVNTGKESLLNGWWNRLMGKYLYRESDIPVLTIAPQYDMMPIN